jgi:hypothetical protein
LLELRIESGNQETHKMLKFCQFGKEKNHHLAKIPPKTKTLPMSTKKHKTARIFGEIKVCAIGNETFTTILNFHVNY